MPGLYTIKSNYKNKKTNFDNCEYLFHENYMYKKNVKQTNDILSYLIVHEGYPFRIYNLDNINITILGTIYNMSDNEIKTSLKKLIYLYTNKKGIRNFIKDFINKADGDFIIQILIDDDIIIFNDLLGRLPLYYSNSDSFIVASELKSIIINETNLVISRINLLEYFLYEFNLGDYTLYKNIKRLLGGMLLIKNDKLKICSIDKLDFRTKKNMKKNIFFKKCKEELFISVERRINRLSSYEVLCDISGGYDSRTIVGVLNKYKKIKYHTFEYTNDESSTAKQVIKKIVGNLENYKKYSFNNNCDISEIAKYIFINDALTNYYTSTICYKDLAYIKKNLKKKYVRFMGLGVSDFIRHYPFAFTPFLSLKKKRIYNYGCLKKVNILNSLLCLESVSFEKMVISYFKNISEKKDTDILKKLYFEYQTNYVSIAGEERERNHFWGVLPLWSLSLMKLIASNLQLEWVGYLNYTYFMSKINPKLLEIKIHGRAINLKSKISLYFYDAYLKNRHYLKYYLFEIFPFFKKDKVSNEYLIKEIAKYEHIYPSEFFFNLELLLKLDDIHLKRILTILVFLDYLNKEFDVRVNYE